MIDHVDYSFEGPGCYGGCYQVQKRDAQGSWSLIATEGDAPGQVDAPLAVTVDNAGNLYVADYPNGGARVQRRDAQGNWAVIATAGSALGHLSAPFGLAVDGARNLYVADTGNDRVQMYVPGGGL